MSRQALIVRGGWDGHQPVETTDAVVPFLRDNGFDVAVHDSTAVYADADVMDTVDLVVQVVTMSTIADDEFAGLQRAVLGGAGLAGWHGGIADAFRNTAERVFVSAPGHRLEVVESQPLRTVIERGLLWAAR